MDKITGWKADRQLHYWRTRLSLPEATDHLRITKAGEPDTVCLLSGNRRFTVPPKRCPCPKVAPESSHAFSANFLLSKWWRQRNKLNDRFSISQPVTKSFCSTTPDLSDPQNQIKAAIWRPIFKKHLSLSLQSIQKRSSLQICRPRLEAAESRNTNYQRSLSWAAFIRRLQMQSLNGRVIVEFNRILWINPSVKQTS